MSGNTYELRRVSTEWFRQQVGDSLHDKEFFGDRENCALVSDELTKLKDDGVWMAFRGPNENSKKRRLHCIPVSYVEPNVVCVKEDVFFNVCNYLELNAVQDECQIHCTMLTKAYLPCIAESVRVALINQIANTSADEIDKFLHIYFEVPKFLYANDIFTIPLDVCPSLAKLSKYLGISDLHFKVISANTSDDKENIDKGFYVLKNHSNLFCVTAVSSFLPPKSLKIVTRSGNEISRVPPDLQKHVQQFETILQSFMNTSTLDCLPIFLMTGAQGSGKMTTLNLVAQLMGLHLIEVNAFDISNLGASAFYSKIKMIFKLMAKLAPCILAFTAFETIGKDKNGNEDVAVVNIFLNVISSLLQKIQFPAFFVGVANCKIDNILPSLSRAFVHFIKFQAPNHDLAIATLSWISVKMGFNVEKEALLNLGSKITGFLHADLKHLIKLAVQAMLEDNLENSTLQTQHLLKAIAVMESAYSDSIGAAKVPNVRWDDVGGLSALKDEIMLTLNAPLQRPGLLSGGLRRSGILFYGPPGTGKTLMAKAVATESAMNFLSVKGPELMNMYVGESERNVREVFSRGREAAPCILFFDELDSLAPNRGKNGDSGGVTNRVVSQILAEMDGLQSNRGLFVIAATNRPDLVDPALLRPGRFDKMFYLGPCTDTESKLGVLNALTNKFLLSNDVDLTKVANSLPQQVTGADVYSVCSNAWLSAARRGIENVKIGNHVNLPLEVNAADFDEGVAVMVPSLTPADLAYYAQMASSSSSSSSSN